MKTLARGFLAINSLITKKLAKELNKIFFEIIFAIFSIDKFLLTIGGGIGGLEIIIFNNTNIENLCFIEKNYISKI